VRIPDPWAFVLLSLATYRAVRLIGWDTITRSMRERLCHVSERDGYEWVGRGRYRPALHEWIHCPWCLGFWVSAAAWLSWLGWPRATLAASVPLAISAVVGLVAKNLDE